MHAHFRKWVMMRQDQEQLLVADDLVVNIRAFNRQIEKCEISLGVQQHIFQ